jgi:cardiolipin synthase A/B
MPAKRRTPHRNICPLPDTQRNLEIVGARGPLTSQQSKTLLARIITEPSDAGVLQRHLAIKEAMAGSPSIAGNRTQLLRGGPASFRAMFKANPRARCFVAPCATIIAGSV